MEEAITSIDQSRQIDLLNQTNESNNPLASYISVGKKKCYTSPANGQSKQEALLQQSINLSHDRTISKKDNQTTQAHEKSEYQDENQENQFLTLAQTFGKASLTIFRKAQNRQILSTAQPNKSQNQEQALSNTSKLRQKLKSKTVKIKLQGFQQLEEAISGNKTEQLQLIQISQILKQNNPACLQKALKCFDLWVEYQNQWGEQQLKKIIEYGFINGKNNNKVKAVAICSKIMHLKSDLLQNVILEGLRSKQIKFITGYLSLVNSLINQSKEGKFNQFKSYFPEIARLINQEKLLIVKNQGMSILKNAYKSFDRNLVYPLISSQLTQFQKKEIQGCEPNNKSQQKLTRTSKLSQFIQSQIAGQDLLDIFKIYDLKWAESVFNTQKWNQKIKFLQEFIDAAQKNKIILSDHKHILDLCKKLFNDSNSNVVQTVLKLLSVLAKKLQKNFLTSTKVIFPYVLPKLKDKKTQMIDQTLNTLKQFNKCINLEDVLDDLKTGLNDKTPNLKIHLLHWVLGHVEFKISDRGQLSDKSKQTLRQIYETFEKLLVDSSGEVRTSMTTVLEKLKSLLGAEFFNIQSKKSIKKAKSASKQKRKSLSKSKQKINLQNSFNLTGQFKKQQSFSHNGKENLTKIVKNLLPKIQNLAHWEQRKLAIEQLTSQIEKHNYQVQIGCLNQLMPILKLRLKDPNPNVITASFTLVEAIFKSLSETEVKVQAKIFLSALVEGLTQKSGKMRKQFITALNNLSIVAGKEIIFHFLANFLQKQNREARIEILNYIIEKKQQLSQKSLKQYVKGIIICLIDKNKDVRQVAEKILQFAQEKLGLSIFKEKSQKYKTSHGIQLNKIFSKYDKCVSLQASMQTSMTSLSPKMKHYTPPIANLRDRRSNFENRSKTAVENTNNFLSDPGFFFAPIEYLTLQRVQRQAELQNHKFNCFELAQAEEDILKQRIKDLFKEQLSKKMLSFNAKRVQDFTYQFIKLCKQAQNHGPIREVYDIIIKWVFLRFWQGSPSLTFLIQILPPLLSILEKKRSLLINNEIDILIGLLREYFISTFLGKKKVSQSLSSIIHFMTSLNSGYNVVKCFASQFKICLKNIHSSLTIEADSYYKGQILKIIKLQLINFVESDQILLELSKIQQIAHNQEFVKILQKKFNQTVLKNLGFLKQNSSKVFKKQQGYRGSAESNSKMTTTYPSKIGENTLCIFNKSIMSNSLNGTFRQVNNQEILEKIELNIDSYVSPHPSSPLGKNLDRLFPPKQTALKIIATMLSEEQFQEELKTYNKFILAKIIRSVEKIFEQRNQYHPDNIISQVGLLQKALKCKAIIGSCGQILQYLLNFAIRQLTYEDDHKKQISKKLNQRKIQFSIELFIKVVNGVILRILQNFSAPEVCNTLITLATKNPKSSHSQLKINLLISKCLTRVYQNFAKQASTEQLQDFIYKINQFLHAIGHNQPFQQIGTSKISEKKVKPQSMITVTIKNIVTNLCEKYQSKIWRHYDKVLKISNYPDYYIGNYISYLNIPYPQKHSLKSIIQLLSKIKTFQSGIQKLNHYMQTEKDFSPKQYFEQNQFDSKFIQMVMQALKDPTQKELEKYANEIKEQSQKRPTSRDNRVEEKLQKLRQKFAEIKPKKQNLSVEKRQTMMMPKKATQNSQILKVAKSKSNYKYR